MNEDIKDENEPIDEYSSTVSKVDSDKTSSSDEDVDVAFLLVDETPSESRLFAVEEDKIDDAQRPFPVLEEIL